MTAKPPQTPVADTAEIEALRARLHEAEETLEAIRGGQVDALVVDGTEGERIFSLRGAEHSYRLMVEEMHEGRSSPAPRA